MCDLIFVIAELYRLCILSFVQEIGDIGRHTIGRFVISEPNRASFCFLVLTALVWNIYCEAFEIILR